MKSIDDNKLIAHLEQMLVKENEKLNEMAINAMEKASRSPFAELSLVNSQKDYQFKQQRVLGIIDTIEEAKAFLEGFYDGPPHDEEEGE